MAQRRTHSSLDKLPALLKDELVRMLVDNEYPVEFQGDKTGKPKYEDLVAYCTQRGHKISKSAVGRFAQSLKIIERMKTSGLIARQTMAGLTDENAPQTQKAAAEMATALSIEFMASNDDFTSKQIKEIGDAIRSCAQVGISADKYIREQAAIKAEKADKAISEIAKKTQISPEVLKQIREQVYGIVS